MGSIVTIDDINGSNPRTVSVNVTSVELTPSRLAKNRRKQLIVTNLTAGVTVTITKGDGDAVANNGIVLSQNQSYIEATDSGFACYQGPYQVVASGAGTVAISEDFE